MEKKNKNGGKTEHGHPITTESSNGKKNKKRLPDAKDGGGGSGVKTEHGARGPKPLGK
jgi:hypothetical protein